jgi:hypothetical protein
MWAFFGPVVWVRNKVESVFLGQKPRHRLCDEVVGVSPDRDLWEHGILPLFQTEGQAFVDFFRRQGTTIPIARIDLL